MGETSEHTFQNQENTTMLVIQVSILQYTVIGETSQHTFLNQENATMLVIQVNILMDKAIQKHPWVKQVNILFKMKKT